MNKERAKEENPFIPGIDAYSSFVSWYFQTALASKYQTVEELI